MADSRVFGKTILTHAARSLRRVERMAQLAGAVDPLDAIAHFKEGLTKTPNVRQDPAPEVGLLDTHLVGTVIAARPFGRTSHHRQVYFDTDERMVRVSKQVGWLAPKPAQIMRTAPL